MTQEQWKPVLGFEGVYEVSDQGRVKGLSRTVPHGKSGYLTLPEKVLSDRVAGSNGHRSVGLYASGKGTRRYTHRLVLESFVGPAPESKPFALHNDGDTSNNVLSNLRWGSNSDNLKDSVSHGTHVMARKTHCKHGHEFTKENTYLRSGSRTCRKCADRRRNEYLERLASRDSQ